MKENRAQVDVVESGEPLREFWNKADSRFARPDMPT